MPNRLLLTLLPLAGALALGPALLPAAKTAATAPAPLDAQRAPKPDQFAIVFSFGYAADLMPTDDAKFEALLVKIKAAGFNVVHAVPTDTRLALCARHGVKMMVDLLAPSCHIYQNKAGAQALCQKLRGHRGVWGYNIWNDGLPATGGRFRQHVNNVRSWDPTHPVYLCTEDTAGMDKVDNADVISYWDYYWDRDTSLAFRHLAAFWRWARQRDQWLYIWIGASPGKPAGPQDVLRTGYTVNTSLACGMKGVLWFLATSIMDPTTLEWKPAAKDVLALNAQLTPLGPELIRLGNPVALHSTSVTRTADNKPLPGGKPSAMPAGLEASAFPADLWLQPLAGEFVLGLFNDGPHAAAFLANHNALAEQAVSLKTTKPLKVSLFNRQTRQWQPLPQKDGVVSLQLAPAGGELLRFE